MAADVAKYLKDNGCVRQCPALAFECLVQGVDNTATSGFFASIGTEQVNGFSRHNDRCKAAMLAVFVHDPGQHITVCVDVRYGNVDRGTDDLLGAGGSGDLESTEIGESVRPINKLALLPVCCRVCKICKIVICVKIDNTWLSTVPLSLSSNCRK